MLPEEMTKQMTLSRWWDNLDKLFTRAVPVEKKPTYCWITIMTVSANWITPSRHGGNTVLYYHRRSRLYHLFNFHVMGYGKNPTEEYESEMARQNPG